MSIFFVISRLITKAEGIEGFFLPSIPVVSANMAMKLRINAQKHTPHLTRGPYHYGKFHTTIWNFLLSELKSGSEYLFR